MKFARSVLSVAMAAAFSLSMFAQQPTTGYHTVACVKVKADKGSEFRKFAAEDLRKFAQARVDSGALSSWLLLRSVAPQGTSADCDFLTVSMFPAAPPQPLGVEEIGAVLKKAGMSMSGQEFVDRRNSLVTLVSNNLFQNRGFVGAEKKGDYLMVNFMKVPNIDGWLAFEKKVWTPLAEAMAKDGSKSGWSVNVQVLPNGSDLAFQAVTVDVYPSWDAIFKEDALFAERFKKVHPDMELGTTFEQFEKLRTISSVKLYALDDMVTAAK